jgi:hypothetical protein
MLRPRARRGPHVLGVALALAFLSPSILVSEEMRSSRAGGGDFTTRDSATEPEASATFCCPGVINFGNTIDFNLLPDREEVQGEYRTTGVLFGRGASGEAPPTLVQIDWSRSSGCRKVLSGDPAFQGWEFFIFVDSLLDKWAAVQKVGASIGYCDFPHSCFIAAYDAQGNLLQSKFNDGLGLQFVTIERPTTDIKMFL